MLPVAPHEEHRDPFWTHFGPFTVLDGCATELIIKPCPLASQMSCTFSTTSLSSVLTTCTVGVLVGWWRGLLGLPIHGAEEPVKNDGRWVWQRACGHVGCAM